MMLALGAVICLPSMVMAWTLPTTFVENGTDPNNVNYGQFDKIEVFMIDGTTFDAPFIQEAGIAGDGWSSTLVNPTYSLAMGPLTSTLGPFTVELPDPSSTPHVLDYFVYRDNTLLYSQRITWDGTGSGGDYQGWSYPVLPSDGSTYTYDGSSDTYDRTDPPSQPIPIPSTLLLLGSGVIGLVLWRGQKIPKP